MNINISKFDLLYWLRGCASSSHLAQDIWRRCIDEFYDKLSPQERLCVYMYAKRDLTDRYVKETSVGREDYFKFLACFNPANRYMVAVEGDINGKHKRELVDAYKYDGIYWVSYRRYIPEEYIKSVDPDKVSLCSAGYCMWHRTCKRYSDDPSITERHVFCGNVRCDWYIDKDTDHGANLKHFE